MENKNILTEVGFLKSELMFETALNECKMSKSDKDFMLECHAIGYSHGKVISSESSRLNESIDEGLWDRIKAGTAGAYQGLKNVSDFGGGKPGNPLAKDIAIKSRLAAFKKNAAPFIGDSTGGSTQSTAPVQSPTTQATSATTQAPVADAGQAPKSKIDDIVTKKLDDGLKQVEAKAAKEDKEKGPLKPEEAIKMVPANTPLGLKDKFYAAIRKNPKASRFLLGALAFGAGVAGSLTPLGPVGAKVAGGAIYGIGNAIIAKAEGASTSTALVRGAAGALTGVGLAGMGGAATNAIQTAITSAIPDATTNALPYHKPHPNVPVADSNAVSPGIPLKPDDGVVTSTDIPEPATPQAAAPAVPPAYRAPTALGGARYDDLIKKGYDPSQLTTNAAGYTSPIDTSAAPINPSTLSPEQMWKMQHPNAKGAQLLMQPWLKKESMFVKGENKHQFKLSEALAPGVKTMLDDVIKDLSTSLNARDINDLLRKLEASKEHYQDEYKFLLKALELDGRIPASSPADGQTPANQTPVTAQTPAGETTNPSLIKNITTLKSNPLFAGSLSVRLKNLLTVKDDPKNLESKIAVRKLKNFLVNINSTIIQSSAKFKQKLGDINVIRKDLVNPNIPAKVVKEAAADILKVENDRKLFLQQLNQIMPSIISVTIGLRQELRDKTKDKPKKVATPTAPIKEEAAQLNASNIVLAKAFLTKLIDMEAKLKKLNVNDKDSLKDLLIFNLDFANVLVNKTPKGTKTNKVIDSALQGVDILGGSEEKSEPKSKPLTQKDVDDAYPKGSLEETQESFTKYENFFK